MSENSPIGGMSRGDISVPRLYAVTCVDCEGRKEFDPAHNTDGGLAYECEDCGHVVELDLDPEQ